MVTTPEEFLEGVAARGREHDRELHQLPGFTPLRQSLRQWLGYVGQPVRPAELANLTLMALATVAPHLKAELLADLADDMLDLAGQYMEGLAGDALRMVARALDEASYGVRVELPPPLVELEEL